MSRDNLKLYAILIMSASLLIGGCRKKLSRYADNRQVTVEILQETVWRTEEGAEYEILSIGESSLPKNKERMMTVKYLSKDPNSKEVRDKEFKDLYIYIAKNFKLDEFDFVCLTGVDKIPEEGTYTVSGYRDAKPVEEVRKMAE